MLSLYESVNFQLYTKDTKIYIKSRIILFLMHDQSLIYFTLYISGILMLDNQKFFNELVLINLVKLEN